MCSDLALALATCNQTFLDAGSREGAGSLAYRGTVGVTPINVAHCGDCEE